MVHVLGRLGQLLEHRESLDEEVACGHVERVGACHRHELNDFLLHLAKELFSEGNLLTHIDLVGEARSGHSLNSDQHVVDSLEHALGPSDLHQEVLRGDTRVFRLSRIFTIDCSRAISKRCIIITVFIDCRSVGVIRLTTAVLRRR